MRGTPTHQPAAFNLGVVNLQKGDLDVSNRWFRKAVELGPTIGSRHEGPTDAAATFIYSLSEEERRSHALR